MSTFVYTLVATILVCGLLMAVLTLVLKAKEAKDNAFWNMPRVLLCIFSWLVGLSPLIIAISLSIFAGMLTYGLANELTIQEGVRATRFDHFLHGRPNEIGDTLAGFFGTLTLVWVVASVVQQSMELRAQRREFQEMVEAQKSQVKAFSAQTNIFLDEKRRRDEQAVRDLLDEKIATLVHHLDRPEFRSIMWSFSKNDLTHTMGVESASQSISAGNKDANSNDEWIAKHFQHWSALPESLREVMQESDFVYLPRRRPILNVIQEKITEIRDMWVNGSDFDRERLTRVHAGSIGHFLYKIIADDHLWDTGYEDPE